MITDYLVDQNLRVSAAADGGEMWRVLAAGAVDLVILDLN
jgi:DNA-binding response OmpR family regulator